MKHLLKFIILAFAIFTMTNNTNAQNLDEMWKEVSEYERKGMPKSALQVVDSIYNLSVRENEMEHACKAIVYRIKLNNYFQDDQLPSYIDSLQKDVGKYSPEMEALLNVLIGRMYLIYYDAKSWNISQRTSTGAFAEDDIKTWTTQNFRDMIIQTYRNALKNPQLLSEIPITKYPELIEQDKYSYKVEPTLLDFIVHDAVRVIMKPMSYYDQPKEEYIESSLYFNDARLFVNKDIDLKNDSQLKVSLEFLQLLLSEQLKNDKYIYARVYTDLTRLQLVKKHASDKSASQSYFNALFALREKYKGYEAVAEIDYALAEWYKEKGEANQYVKGDTLKAFYLEKANDICDIIIRENPKSRPAQQARSMKYELNLTSLNLTMDNFVSGKSNFPVLLEYKNLSEAHLSVYSVNPEDYLNITRNNYGEKRFEKLLKASQLIRENKIDLPGKVDRVQHSTEFVVEKLPVGFYFVLISEKPITEDENSILFKSFSVTNLAWTTDSRTSETYLEMFVLDREKGKALKNIDVTVYKEEYSYRQSKYIHKTLANLKTGKDGRVCYNLNENSNSYVFRFKSGDENLMTSSIYYGNYGFWKGDNRSYETVNFFTDRAVYRPGQTIHVKGICLRNQGKSHELMKNFSTTAYLYDANYQQIASKSVKTNEYGSFTVDFIIPEGLLNGNLQIRANSSSAYVKLEEYKRPAFEVKLNDFNGNYQLNKKVKVSGEALSYTGAKITDANVKYRVFSQPKFFNSWRYFYYPANRELLDYGELKTDENGQFSLEFLAEPMPNYPVNQDVSFYYFIEVDVTDMTGETQTTSGSLIVGYRDLVMSTNLSDENDISDLDSVQISTQNLNGENITAKGTILFFALETPDIVLNKRQWTEPEYKMYSKDEWQKLLPYCEYENETDLKNYKVKDKVFSIPFNTKESNKYLLPDEKLKPGVYKLEIRASDAFGMPVIEEEYVRITDNKSKKLSADIPFQFNAGNRSKIYHPGEELEIMVGSGCKDVSVFVLVEHEDDKVLYKNWIKLSRETRHIKIPISEELRGGIYAGAFMVYHGRFYHKTINLTVPYDNKKLDFEFVYFRDEVLPGSKEQIIMKICNNNDEAVAAEMLACMYDASLDAFYVNDYQLNLFAPYYPSHDWISTAFSYNHANSLLYNKDIDNTFVDGEIPVLNLFGLNYYGSYRYYSKGDMRMSRANVDNAELLVVEEDVEEELLEEEAPVQELGSADKKLEDSVEVPKPISDKEVQIRENFNETAFFYPQLRTDKDGKVSFVFTAPESLTRWKFLALAHTQDLKTGVIKNYVTTKKQLMVTPNMPRFLREGDKITLSVKVTNLTADDMQGNCEISLIDVMTGKNITAEILTNTQPANFNVKAGGNSSVKFDLNIPMGLQAVEYTIIAKSGAYGDGEKRIVPILSNRMLVTESMPMYVNGNSRKTWKFNKLLKSKSGNTLKHHKLSLEMTPRPAWYAVQALPYLIEYPYECSEQMFSRFYANSMAAHIANSDPQIERIFKAWKNIPESKALNSNLQKNEDLKSLMLQQTPWVLQAQDESERKRRVGVLFDLNRMANEQRSTFNKLKKRQKANGAWPWFEGMPESRYITQHIVAGFGHLRHLNVLNETFDGETRQMLSHASMYLDNQILSDYRTLKRYYKGKDLSKNHLSYMQIHYLYTRSFTMEFQPINSSAKEAYDYYYNQAKKYWVEFNPYSKAMIALIMHRSGDKTTANQIITSLKEYAIESDEMGMYWKSTVGYYWYQAPIETQALLIEAFDEIMQDSESVERMKQWLLNQKRTQDWGTTKATTEAIYALILTGDNLLDLSSNVVVEIGGKIYNPKTDDNVQAEAGTGYFRKDWSAGEIRPEMGEVKLTKTGSGMAWGALHWQYFEDLDKITSHETPLQLEKKLFRKVATDNGVELQQVKENEAFHIGDQLVVRVILRSDRDMEYVHMKDMRASCLEPVTTRSGYQYQDGLGYYMSVRDASVDFFFAWLSKGTYVFEYNLYVTHKGDFSNGITTIQCMYAPEFNSHSEGLKIKVD